MYGNGAKKLLSGRMKVVRVCLVDPQQQEKGISWTSWDET